MEHPEKFDLIILGGGLAGLTLALQVKQSRPESSILILEKRHHKAPTAIHKVGESTSELGSYYLREVLNLKAYLTTHHLPKFGFRFFFSPEHSDNIARRVEVGSRIMNPFPTHQIDRGIFENDLEEMVMGKGSQIESGARIVRIDHTTDGYGVVYEKASAQHLVYGKWVIDASGRSSVLKRAWNLTKESDHTINAAWFRVEANIDIHTWSDNLLWHSYVDPGRRRLATNHLMGEGYWVWIIPLISGCTSFGIVADPRVHPFESFNTTKKSMQWLSVHEPKAAEVLSAYQDRLLDFKVMKNFAYDCKQFYSSDRWAITGEAGAFLDPFYSPGTDFIALGNTWITDLVTRDLNGEDIRLRTMIFEHAHQELLKGWSMLYKNMYSVFGNTQVMLMKIVWDWASYWAIPNVMFTNNGYTDIAILKQYSSSTNSIGRRFASLNERMQELFRNWNSMDTTQFESSYHNVFDLQCLHQFQSELTLKHDPGILMNKIRVNLEKLECIAAEIFRMASARINGTPEDMKVDPNSMMLNEGRENLLAKSERDTAMAVVPEIKEDIATMWLKAVPTPSNAYAD
jgi:flavin-dependent dehydrogenase